MECHVQNSRNQNFHQNRWMDRNYLEWNIRFRAGISLSFDSISHPSINWRNKYENGDLSDGNRHEFWFWHRLLSLWCNKNKKKILDVRLCVHVCVVGKKYRINRLSNFLCSPFESSSFSQAMGEKINFPLFYGRQSSLSFNQSCNLVLTSPIFSSPISSSSFIVLYHLLRWPMNCQKYSHFTIKYTMIKMCSFVSNQRQRSIGNKGHSRIKEMPRNAFAYEMFQNYIHVTETASIQKWQQ